MAYLTAGEVAARLRVHERTVRRWLQAGELVGYPMGDRAGWRVEEADLQAFLEERRRREIGADEKPRAGEPAGVATPPASESTSPEEGEG